jgi:hypothetical protein
MVPANSKRILWNGIVVETLEVGLKKFSIVASGREADR